MVINHFPLKYVFFILFSFFLNVFISLQLSASECSLLIRGDGSKISETVSPKAVVEEVLSYLKSLNIERIPNLSELDMTEFELKILKRIAAIEDQGQLESVIQQIVFSPQVQSKISFLSPQKVESLIQQLVSVLRAEVNVRGLTQAFKKNKKDYIKWSDLNRQVHLRLENSGESLLLENPEQFLKEFSKLVNTSFTGNEKVEILVDGPRSFEKREELFRRAKKRIQIFVWGVYDDFTGNKTAEQLIQKVKEGVDVQMIVDGQVAQRMGKNLEKMEQNGVQILRWHHPQHPYFGQHRKSIIVDGEELIAGGLNIGDFYSHLGPEGSPKWRDTDVYIQGSTGLNVERVFVEEWNSQIRLNRLPLQPIEVEVQKNPISQEGIPVAVINHKPGVDFNGLLAVLKAIQGASKTIDIENAYFISHPLVQKGLKKAIERGVNVRLFTNSMESVDEPIVAVPIIKSVKSLKKLGVKVFLKKGDTLHSKTMVVDNTLSFIQSYNLHPRSLRYEGEFLFVVYDSGKGKEFSSIFNEDIQDGIEVKDHNDLNIPNHILSILGLRLFFNQL